MVLAFEAALRLRRVIRDPVRDSDLLLEFTYGSGASVSIHLDAAEEDLLRNRLQGVPLRP